jgi:hypothetical protein
MGIVAFNSLLSRLKINEVKQIATPLVDGLPGI